MLSSQQRTTQPRVWTCLDYAPPPQSKMNHFQLAIGGRGSQVFWAASDCVQGKGTSTPDSGTGKTLGMKWRDIIKINSWKTEGHEMSWTVMKCHDVSCCVMNASDASDTSIEHSDHHRALVCRKHLARSLTDLMLVVLSLADDVYWRDQRWLVTVNSDG